MILDHIHYEEINKLKQSSDKLKYEKKKYKKSKLQLKN